MLTRIFSEFFSSERAGGYVLMGCALLALILANSPWAEAYLDLWQTPLPGGSLSFWINDGLMAVFFLLVGLEIERELYIGELSDWREALAPILAAVGGMLVPALLYTAFNAGRASRNGFAVPMATDIAFALGVLGLARGVPPSLKVFLAALAIIDDLGAVLVIAVFYGRGLSWAWLGFAAGVLAVMAAMNRLRVRRLAPYLLGAGVIWYALHHAGIHPTLAGVITAFAVPFGDGGTSSPSYRLQHFLHRPVALVIMPLFGLANAGVTLSPAWARDLGSPIGLGVLAGLLIGKPIGVLAGVWLSKRLKAARETRGEPLSWGQYGGAAVLAGIGFTMSIFITLLAFESSDEIRAAKTAIFAASFLAGLAGFLLLNRGRTSSRA